MAVSLQRGDNPELTEDMLATHRDTLLSVLTAFFDAQADHEATVGLPIASVRQVSDAKRRNHDQYVRAYGQGGPD